MSRIKIGDLLLQEGLIDEMQLKSALSHQRQWGGFVGQILIEHGYVSELKMYDTIAKKFGQRRIELGNRKVPPHVVQALSPNICIEKNVFPVEFQDRSLVIATCMPQDVTTTDQIAFQLGVRVDSVLATPREIEWAIRFYHQGDPSPCPPPKEAVAKATAPESAPQSLPASGLGAQEHGSLLGQIEADIHDPFTGSLSGEYHQSNLGMGAQQPPLAAAQPNVMANGPQPMRTLVQGSIPKVDVSSSQTPPPKTAAPSAQDFKRQNRLIKSLVELCIEKGVFTADDFRQKLKSLGED